MMKKRKTGIIETKNSINTIINSNANLISLSPNQSTTKECPPITKDNLSKPHSFHEADLLISNFLSPNLINSQRGENKNGQ